MMEQIELHRYEDKGKLGSGADYEVRSAIDRETGLQVVLKRPMPQMITRQMHWATEARTERVIQVHEAMTQNVPGLVPVLGYTEIANHDAFFCDSLGQDYRVTVEERASGIPLYVGDPKAKITGVPVGVAQNLFALFPLSNSVYQEAHPIQRQLLDVQESFLESGYMLFDLGPQNVFFQPGNGEITVIDCGALVGKDEGADSRGRPPKDIHDFYLEMLKFYTTPEAPPAEADGYRDGYGLRPVINFQQELAEMERKYESNRASESAHAPHLDSALRLINNVRQRAYTGLEGFRQDLMEYLDAAAQRNSALPNIEQANQAWTEALGWLRTDYWQRFIFDAERECAAFV